MSAEIGLSPGAFVHAMIVACPVECDGTVAPVRPVDTIGGWGHVNTIISVAYVRMMGCEIVKRKGKQCNNEK